ncbi:T9SS type A sorting domain-containing protein [candidate division KSB1 bacterium]|nr:T9SS type A sorting domain-containing protein [candidate division KSB1 bacterium]
MWGDLLSIPLNGGIIRYRRQQRFRYWTFNQSEDVMPRFLIFYFILISFSFLPAGEEVLINSQMEKNQRNPAIATDGNGHIIVVWTREDSVLATTQKDICLQRLNASLDTQDDVQRVNVVSAGNQESPVVAMNRSGNTVVIWAHYSHPDSMYDIMGQLYSAAGPVGDNFLVNSHISHSQTAPSVAMAADGRFIVVWESWFQDDGDRGIYGQRFDANANRVGDEFRINSTTAFSQARPRVAYTEEGKFVVIWESWNQDSATPSGYGVFGQLFDAEAQKLGKEFRINTYSNDYQWFGDVVAFDDGGFGVVWCSWEQDGDDGGIYLQLFNAAANRVGVEIPVNKTTQHYQWLPRIAKTADDDFAVIWSSWKQDGSREGVYSRFFNRRGDAKSFETRINLTTESYQWEPVMVATGENEIAAVWSAWGQFSENYDIIGRIFSPPMPMGALDPKAVSNENGLSTSQVIVHVMDHSSLTGDLYQLSFHRDENSELRGDIVNLITQQRLVSDFPLNRGSGFLYLTPPFEGLAVEIIPVFELEIDLEQSCFINNSGSNVSINIEKIIDSRKNVAPVDVAIIWGSSDTLASGKYSSPSDTALFDVKIPFKAWDLTQDQALDIWVIEESDSKNKRWDVNEKFRIITPPPYRKRASDSHVEIAVLPSENDVTLPGAGDTVFVYTKRPLTVDDTFRFTACEENVVTNVETNKRFTPKRFSLEQNYPNPFNPKTTIPYYLPKSTHVELNVFNVRGQWIATPVSGRQAAGRHRFLFDAAGMANGIYFYTLSTSRELLTRKMLLLK